MNVATARECEWTARADADWLIFAGSTTGQGPADVAFSVQPNRSTSPRSVGITVADQRATISQEAATCPWNVSPSEVVIGPTGGDRTVRLTTEDFCSWVVTSNEEWVAVASVTSGRGSADITLRIALNSGPERTTNLEVPGGTVMVRQREAPPPPSTPPAVPPPPIVTPPIVPPPLDPLPPTPPAPPPPPPAEPPPPPPPPAPCTFVVTPTEFSDVPASGRTLRVDVTTQPECTWTAASSATWVTISSGATGTGSGRVDLIATENTGAARSGTVVIAGQMVTVNQQGRPPCAYAISPNTYSPSSAGGTISVAVTTTPGCEWTVAGNPAWVSADPTSLTGSGTTTVTVQSNAGAGRAATFQIAGRDFVVEQTGAPCTYAAGRTTRTVPYTRSTREIGVFTQAHCPVTATESAVWIEIVSAPTFGSGEIVIRMEENKGDARSAPITITGEKFTQTITVIQEAKD